MSPSSRLRHSMQGTLLLVMLVSGLFTTRAMALNAFRSQCTDRRKAKGGTGNVFLPALAVPVAGFFGVMCAPVYGKGLPGLGGMIDFETLARRASPNEYLAAPLGSCPKFVDTDATTERFREEAPVYPINADELKKSFEEMLNKRFSVQAFAKPTLSDKEKRQYVYVERTPLLRFPDIINVQFIPLGANTSTLILHSASIYGYSDLGKNRQRVKEMIRDIPNLPPRMSRNAIQV